MDGKKLLTMNGEALSYIGIMYIEEEECIKNLSRNIEAVWKMSKNIL